jgi:hypothetical protein
MADEVERPDSAYVEITLNDKKELSSILLPYAEAEAFQTEIATAVGTVQPIASGGYFGTSDGNPPLFNKHGVMFRTKDVYTVNLRGTYDYGAVQNAYDD